MPLSEPLLITAWRPERMARSGARGLRRHLHGAISLRPYGRAVRRGLQQRGYHRDREILAHMAAQPEPIRNVARVAGAPEHLVAGETAGSPLRAPGARNGRRDARSPAVLAGLLSYVYEPLRAPAT